MIRRLIIALTLISMLFAGGLTRVTQAADAATAMDGYLSSLVARNAFSGSVLVVYGNQVLLDKGYGMADARHPNTPGTEFRIGSITKEFTAMAILQLQEQGRLNVNDAICSYLRTCAASWRSITIHELLTMTSGIARDCGLQAGLKASQVVARCARQPLLFTPGSHWLYSNTGYLMLGLIVERVTGDLYSRYLKDHIIDPIGLTGTGYLPVDPNLPRLAQGYDTSRKSCPNGACPYHNTVAHYAASGLYSTTHDLFTWDQELGTTDLAGQSSLQAMFTSYAHTGDSWHDDYGYGWYLTTRYNRPLIYHDGLYPGFTDINLIWPDDNLTIIVLANRYNLDIRHIGAHLAGFIFG